MREISAIQPERFFEPLMNAVARSRLSSGAPVTSTIYRIRRLRSQHPRRAPPVSLGNFSPRNHRILSRTPSSQTTVKLESPRRNSLRGLSHVALMESLVPSSTLRLRRHHRAVAVRQLCFQFLQKQQSNRPREPPTDHDTTCHSGSWGLTKRNALGGKDSQEAVDKTAFLKRRA